MRTTTYMRAALFILVALAAACDRGTAASGATTTATGTAERAATAPPAPGATGEPAEPHATTPLAGRWTGSYEAVKAPVSVPTGVAYDTWEKDEGTVAVGSGTLEVAIDPTGDATGTADGALGKLTLRGAVDGASLRAELVPSTPDAEVAMQGWLVAEGEGDALDLTLQVSNQAGQLVRTAKGKLKR